MDNLCNTNKHYTVTAVVQKQRRESVEDWRQLALRTPCENFLATPLLCTRHCLPMLMQTSLAVSFFFTLAAE